MTREDALDLLEQYAERVSDSPSAARTAILSQKAEDRRAMLREVEGMHSRFPADGSERKAMRWLGFMQGVLVALGVYTLDEVKEHSRTRRVG